MRGRRVVHSDVELIEKLGRNELCPCDLDAGFKTCCMKSGSYDGLNRDDYF